MKDDKVYLCDICTAKLRLPLLSDKIIAGYCRLCGTASLYYTHLTKKELEQKNIKLINLKELKKNPGNFNINICSGCIIGTDIK